MIRLKWIASATGVIVVAAGISGVALAQARTVSPTAAPTAREALVPATGDDTASTDGEGAGPASSAAASASASSQGSAVASASRSSGTASNTAAQADAATASSPISLSGWAGLILPLNDAGQPTGKDAEVISPAQLESPWLTEADGALRFWAPSGAATTPGSLHSRTELESAVKYDVGTARHELSAGLEIVQLPESNPEICVAQLHAGGSGGSDPFVMFDFKSGRLYVMVASGTSAAPSFYTLLTNVPLNAPFSYRLTDDGNGTLTLAASYGGQSKSYTVAVPAAFKGASGHFSAGDYQQGTVSEGSGDGGRVTFTSLSQS